MAWESTEYDVGDAVDVHEVIAWANDEARKRKSVYTLYAVANTSTEEVLVWLAGVDPTISDGARPNFGRRQPLGVDPVSD